jgi:hypothetical protein
VHGSLGLAWPKKSPVAHICGPDTRGRGARQTAADLCSAGSRPIWSRLAPAARSVDRTLTPATMAAPTRSREGISGGRRRCGVSKPHHAASQTLWDHKTRIAAVLPDREPARSTVRAAPAGKLDRASSYRPVDVMPGAEHELRDDPPRTRRSVLEGHERQSGNPKVTGHAAAQSFRRPCLLLQRGGHRTGLASTSPWRRCRP